MSKQNYIFSFLEQQNKVLLDMLQKKYLCKPIKFVLDTKSYSPLPPDKKIKKILKDGGFIVIKNEES